MKATLIILFLAVLVSLATAKNDPQDAPEANDRVTLARNWKLVTIGLYVITNVGTSMFLNLPHKIIEKKMWLVQEDADEPMININMKKADTYLL